MGILRTPLPVKLFIGMLARDTGLIDKCIQELTMFYGACDLESPLLPWSHTEYYCTEMGAQLHRKFCFFKRLLDPGELPRVKLFMQDLEARYAMPGPSGPARRLNLDPGYVTEAKVVLSSTKDFAHRVYIGNNVFAEVTLRYDKQDRMFVPVEHTYPDFRSLAVRTLFLEARRRLREGLASDRR